MMPSPRIQAVLFALLTASTAGAREEYPFCQMLDRIDEPAWQVQAGYVTESRVETPWGDEFGTFELRGGGGLAYYRTAIGDFDLAGRYDVLIFTGSGGVRLPDQVGAVRLDTSYIWRNAEGLALKFDFWPGFYTDFEDLSGEDIYFPFGLSCIKAFNPQLSAVLGAAIYPGFDREYDPRAGLRYAPRDALVVDLMYPESRITYTPAADWDLYAGVKIDQVSEYRLDSGDRRDAMMYDETRFYFGLNTPLNDTMRMMYQAGWIINRSVDFDRFASKDDIEDGYFVSVGVGGTL